MVKNCGSCGAPCSSVGLTASWKCDHCDSVNYNAEYVSAHLASVDVSKYSSVFRLARVAYESGNYAEAAEKFSRALEEDSSSPDAWAYRGLSLARQVDLSNLGSLPSQVKACFREARVLAGAEGEFVEAAEAIANETLVAVLGRFAARALDEAEKVLFAYSHEPDHARSRASGQFQKAYAACSACLASPSANILQMVDVCRMVFAAHEIRNGVADPGAMAAAEQYLASLRENHPDLYRQLFPPEPPKPEKRACFPRQARVTAPGGDKEIGALHAGDVVTVWDAERACTRAAVVKALRVHLAARVAVVDFDDGGPSLDATLAHSVLASGGWTRVKDLVPGRLVKSLEGGEARWRTVARIRMRSAVVPVYNLEVESPCTFIVGGCVVHSFSTLRRTRTAAAWLREALLAALRSCLDGEPADERRP
jgi:tetratricopeptide (TPR) repeat protein